MEELFRCRILNGIQKLPCETWPDTVPRRAIKSPTNVDNSILIAEKESKSYSRENTYFIALFFSNFLSKEIVKINLTSGEIIIV